MIRALTLKILSGKHAGREIPIRGPKFLIGRGEDCDLRPVSSDVSRHHCALVVAGHEVELQDAGSSNGTQVNGARVVGRVVLAAGDQVKVGPLEFQVNFSAAAAQPAPPAHTSPTATSPSGSERAAAAPQPAGAGENSAAQKKAASDSDIMHWLTDTEPGGQAPGAAAPGPWTEVPPPRAAATDTAKINLDWAQTIPWPEQANPWPQPLGTTAANSPSQPLQPPVEAEAPPANAASSRDAAAAAIDSFRRHLRTPPPKEV